LSAETCVVVAAVGAAEWAMASELWADNKVKNTPARAMTGIDAQKFRLFLQLPIVDGVKYSGPSLFAQVSVSASAPVLQNMTI